MADAPNLLVLGAHPANLGGCLSHLDLMGNPTYLFKALFHSLNEGFFEIYGCGSASDFHRTSPSR
jgi:hypothetical protein